MKIILLLSLIFNSVYAIDITPIEKDEKAPFSGFIIDKDNMKKFRQINEDKKNLEKETILLKDLAAIQEQRVDNLKEQNSLTEKELNREKFQSNLKGIGGFLIGVLATSLAAYAAIRVAK